MESLNEEVGDIEGTTVGLMDSELLTDSVRLPVVLSLKESVTFNVTEGDFERLRLTDSVSSSVYVKE